MKSITTGITIADMPRNQVSKELQEFIKDKQTYTDTINREHIFNVREIAEDEEEELSDIGNKFIRKEIEHIIEMINEAGFSYVRFTDF